MFSARRLAVVVATGSLALGLAWAEESEVDRLKRDRQELDRKIADMEKGGRKTDPIVPAGDEKTIIVTATRVETPAEQIGASASVVPAERFRSLGHTQVQEALRFVPGLHLVRTGTRGGLTSLFTRGGESDYTLVLLDGFKVNIDGGSFDWENMTVDGASRIEVVRGAGSTVYGSDAVAGVINILSERGQGPPTLQMSTEGGNFGTQRERMKLSGGTKEGGYVIDGSYFKQDSGKFENSDFEDLSFSGRFDQRISATADLTFTVRSLHSELGVYTAGNGQRFDPPDPNDSRVRNDLLTGVTIRTEPTDRWESQLRFFRYINEAKTNILRDNHLSAGTGRDTSDFFALTDFERVGADWQNTYSVTDATRIVAGLESEHEARDDEETDEARSDRAVYLEGQTGFADRLFLTAGGRLDQQSDFGDEPTGRVTAAYLAPTDTKLHAAAASGIKTPSLAEVVGDAFTPGLRSKNQGVRVEKSRTYEMGVDQNLLDKTLRLSATGFYNLYRDLVEYEGGTVGYGQGGNAFSRGTEAEIQWKPTKQWDVNGNWTNLSTEVTSTKTSGTLFIRGDQLLRRPSNTGSLILRHRLYGDDRLELSAAGRYTGDWDDRDFNASASGKRVMAPDYTVWDLGASWRFAEHWRLFGSARNLLNDSYEAVFGYPADGRTYTMGVEYTIRL